MTKGPSLTNRIKFLLEGSPGEPWSPWQIGQILKENRKSISSICSRLKKKGWLFQYKVRGKPPMPGFYMWTPPVERAPLDDQHPTLEIHNFQIWIERPLIDMNGRTLQILGKDILDEIKKKLPYAEIEEKRTSTYAYYKLGPDRNLTLQVAPKGSVTIWTECSKSPIPVPDFSLYLRFLEMLFSEFWHTSNPRVRQLDFNKDYQNITVNGFSNITVQECENQLIQIYNKGSDLRTEKRFFTNLSPETLAKEIEKIGKDGNNLVTQTYLQEALEKVNSLENSHKDLKKELGELTQSIHTLIVVYNNPGLMKTDPGPSNIGYG